MRLGQNASVAADLKPHQRLSAALGKRAMPVTDRVIVQQKNPRHLLAAQAIVEQRERIWLAEPTGASPTRRAPARSVRNVHLPTRSQGEFYPQTNPSQRAWQELFAFPSEHSVGSDSDSLEAVAGAPGPEFSSGQRSCSP